MMTLSYILSGLSLLMSVLFLVRLRFPLGFFALWIPRLTAGALSPYWAFMGVVGSVIGWAYHALWAIPMGIAGAGIMIWYVWRSTQDHRGFEDAFGAGWPDQIPPEQARHMVQNRWTWFLRMKASPEPSWVRDIAFWTVPGTERRLLCDMWSPADGNVSGLALVYVHGGGWCIGDKDMLTRPFFRHLVAQGHTVMDVSYRLCPEVDIYGMIGDLKHAIAWIKANASRYGVNPEKVVLAGGSAGGHLALMAGYTPQHPELTPDDLRKADLSVCGIVSYCPPTDLMVMYQHTGQHRLVDLPPVPVGPDSTMGRRDFARLDVFLGGWPGDTPDAYELGSPATHVQPDSPPTLLIHGDKDVLVPVEATRALCTKLGESGVPAINVVFPCTDHAFDLMLPQVNPAAQSALYDVDRFLALLSNKEER
ncbi:MAG: alpha/beta hydrolase [Anaerolineae bacterium]